MFKKAADNTAFVTRTANHSVTPSRRGDSSHLTNEIDVSYLVENATERIKQQRVNLETRKRLSADKAKIAANIAHLNHRLKASLPFRVFEDLTREKKELAAQYAEIEHQLWILSKDRKAGNGRRGHKMIEMRGTYKMVHRAVLEAFVGPCPEGMECCHIDGDPTNNRVENLRWGTSKENKQDQIRHGNSRRGEKNAGNILSEDQVRTILAKLGQGVTRGQLSREYKTTRENIRNIQLGFTWRHVSGLPQPPEEAAARSRAQAAARERRRLKRELCK